MFTIFLYDFSDNYIFVKDYYYAERATICNSFFLLGLIFIGNIKENENSDLEIYCKKRLRLYLMLNIGIGVVLFEFCEQQVLNVYMETLLLIVISSVLQNRKSFLKD